MGGKIKTWKKRWFVFDRNRRTLAYYAGNYTEYLVKHIKLYQPCLLHLFIVIPLNEIWTVKCKLELLTKEVLLISDSK